VEGEHLRYRTWVQGARLPLPHLRELVSVRGTMGEWDLQRIYVKKFENSASSEIIIDPVLIYFIRMNIKARKI
jgi:hypothetical protein